MGRQSTCRRGAGRFYPRPHFLSATQSYSQFFMKPHSVGLDEITMENILAMDLEGNVVAGTSRRHSEVYIHSEIYKVRPDVHCVIHTHPLYFVALSATGRPMRCYSQPSALFYEELGVYTDTINLIPQSDAMGAGVAKALGPHRAVLLKNHGVVVVGASIAEGSSRRNYAGERREGANHRRGGRRHGSRIPRRHRETQARHQPARSVCGQFRLSGTPSKAPRFRMNPLVFFRPPPLTEPLA